LTYLDKETSIILLLCFHRLLESRLFWTWRFKISYSSLTTSHWKRILAWSYTPYHISWKLHSKVHGFTYSLIPLLINFRCATLVH